MFYGVAEISGLATTATPHALAHSYLQGGGCVSARKSSSKRKSSGRKYSKKAGEEVRTEMHHKHSGQTQGKEPQTGHRDRAFQGPPKRRQSSEESGVGRRSFF
jgi:hypothetical protein